MTLKKQERKDGYVEILRLMLEEQHEQAFDKLASMCGRDTGLFFLADYKKAVAEIRARKDAN